MLNTIEIRRLETLWTEAARGGIFHVSDCLEAMLIVHGVEFEVFNDPYFSKHRIEIHYPGGTDNVKP